MLTRLRCSRPVFAGKPHTEASMLLERIQDRRALIEYYDLRTTIDYRYMVVFIIYLIMHRSFHGDWSLPPADPTHQL